MEHKKLRLTIIRLESGYIVAAERTNVPLAAFDHELDFEHAIAEGDKDGVHSSVKDALDYFLKMIEYKSSKGSDGKD